MEFDYPRLDDREFGDIVDEARRRIAIYAPEWTDHNISDPGITLIELFAWMTDIVLYRLNRVPDKHYVKFMELIGMRLREPEVAQVPVTMWLTAPQPLTVTIPAGTEVSTVRTDNEDAIIFRVDVSTDILVPDLEYIYTTEGGGMEGLNPKAHQPNALASGSTKLKLFPSLPPRVGDAAYFGFEQDVSNHILGFSLEVEDAEGAGVDPHDPPYAFEVLDDTQTWVQVGIDIDETEGLNQSGMIRIFLPELRQTVRNEKAAYWVRLRLIDPGNGRIYGVSPEVERLTVASWGATTVAMNMSRHFNELLGRADGTMGQRFFLSHTPIVVRSTNERIIVQKPNGTEEEWQEVSDFSNSKETDRHYTINSQTGEIRFGLALPQRDGQVKKFGDIPEKDSYILMGEYRSGGGKSGNVAAGTVRVLRTSIPYIERILNRTAASGGLDAENLQTAKARVPGYLRSLQRAVTAADYEYLTIEAFRGRIGRVHCLQPPQTTAGKVTVLIVPHIPQRDGASKFIPPNSFNLPPAIKEEVRAYLDERRLLSTQLEIIEPTYQWVETFIDFRPARGHDENVVKQRIEDRLFDFLNPITGGATGHGWAFGRDLYTADMTAVLLAVPGVEFVRATRLHQVLYRREDDTFTRIETPVESIELAPYEVITSYRHTANPI